MCVCVCVYVLTFVCMCICNCVREAVFIQSHVDISACFAAWTVETQNVSFHTEAMWISGFMNEK